MALHLPVAERPVHPFGRGEAVNHRLPDRDRELAAEIGDRVGGLRPGVVAPGVVAPGALPVARPPARPHRAPQFALEVFPHRLEVHELVEGFGIPGGDRLPYLPSGEIGTQIDATAEGQQDRPGDEQPETRAAHFDNTNGPAMIGFLRKRPRKPWESS